MGDRQGTERQDAKGQGDVADRHDPPRSKRSATFPPGNVSTSTGAN